LKLQVPANVPILNLMIDILIIPLYASVCIMEQSKNLSELSSSLETSQKYASVYLYLFIVCKFLITIAEVALNLKQKLEPIWSDGTAQQSSRVPLKQELNLSGMDNSFRKNSPEIELSQNLSNSNISATQKFNPMNHAMNIVNGSSDFA
jgi:hypothetical protein